MTAHPVMVRLMLNAFPADPAGAGSSQAAPGSTSSIRRPAERASFEAAFGLRVPAKDELGEIEATSRLQIDKGALYMTAPLILAAKASRGFRRRPALCCRNKLLLTVRSGKSAAFDAVAKEMSGEKLEPSSAFACILEELVDHLADLLEVSGRDLDEASHVIFRQDNAKQLSHETAMLRQLMLRTGRTSERMSRIHYTLVCLDRMAKFTVDRARDWLAQDIASKAAIGQFGYRLAGAIFRRPGQPRPAPARRRDRHHQYRPERRHEGFDHCLGGRNSAGAGRRHLRHEFQEHARARLDVGLSSMGSPWSS